MSANEKPKADRASSWSDRLMAPGDGLRQWWDRLSRVQKWGFGVVGFGLLALLPLFPPPFLNTPNISFGGTMAQFAMVRDHRDRPQRRGRPDRSARPRLRRVLRRRRVHRRPADQSEQSVEQDRPRRLVREDWAWLACVPLAMAITALSGLILGSPTLRLRGDYLAIVTLGFGEIIRLLADNLADVTDGPRGLNEVAYPRLGSDRTAARTGFSPAGNSMGDSNYGTWWFWLGIVLIVIILLFVGNLERSRVGRAWVAIREDEDAAEVMGVHTFKFKLWAFVIGAAIGGLSGALYAGQVQFVAPPTFNIINSMLFLCAVVLGGQGNKLGVMLGAFIIVYLPNRLPRPYELSRDQPMDGDRKYLFFGIALVVLMIFRPAGSVPGELTGRSSTSPSRSRSRRARDDHPAAVAARPRSSARMTVSRRRWPGRSRPRASDARPEGRDRSLRDRDRDLCTA